jgi:DNA modification methylase
VSAWNLHLGDCLDVLKTLPDASVDAVVTDPPYELGFMGKKWDAAGIAYSVPLWTEALRVLKPGGHLLAFGGTRTYHRMACAIEDAGFEVRDSLHWIYGSGFPKSLDVSKAIDKQRDDTADILRVTAAIREARNRAGLSNADIDAHFGTSGMAGHWTSAASQPAVPKWKQWERLRSLLGMGDELDAEVWRLNGRKGTPGEAWHLREVVGQKVSSLGGTVAAGERDPEFIAKHRGLLFDVTAPATDAAKEWHGWGTALKPAHEPVVVARKPLVSTVAENVQQYGTGALNIDGCRVGVGGQLKWSQPRGMGSENSFADDAWTQAQGRAFAEALSSPVGRWPPNLLLSHTPECGEACADECAVAEMDRQSGNRNAGGAVKTQRQGFAGNSFMGGGSGVDAAFAGYGDSGGASRFFPVFKYQAKASRSERERGLNEGQKASHPTVKPVELMRWLVRLVTPRGGVVLDPFTGSGTTGVAALLEGAQFVGIEREPEYHAIASARIQHATESRDKVRESTPVTGDLFNRSA